MTDALERYANCVAWARQHGLRQVFTLLSPVIVLESFDARGEEKEKIFRLCREWGIRLFRTAGPFCFEDCETGERYRLDYSGTYPGMADDAATYQDVYLERAETQEE